MTDLQDMTSPVPAADESPRSGCRSASLARAFVVRAVLWAVAFGIAHLLGFKAYTAILSGTTPYGTVQHVLGLVYIVLYVGLVFLVPVLIIAAVLVKGAALAISVRTARNNTKGSSNNGIRQDS